jgi:hypothetical protein
MKANPQTAPTPAPILAPVVNPPAEVVFSTLDVGTAVGEPAKILDTRARRS